MLGTVFSIEEFSVFDGPGIRTSVFLKGCPLRCSWCHNPEGQSRDIQIVRSPNGCLGCGVCEKYAEYNNSDELVFTERSIKECPRGLLRVCGEEIEADALIEKLMKNERILKNGGGITFSGGEPLMQSEFLIECLDMLKGRLHTAVQTSGYGSAADFNKILNLADYFLFDIKLVDRMEHIKYTGVPNDLILNNFRSLAGSGKDFVIRIPLIPTVTDTERNICNICALLKDNDVDYVELLPYNKMAGSKYKLAGMIYTPMFNENVECSTRAEIFDEYKIKIKIF